MVPQVSASGPGRPTGFPTGSDLQIVKGLFLGDNRSENQSGVGNLGLSAALPLPNPKIWGRLCHHSESQCPHPWNWIVYSFS